MIRDRVDCNPILNYVNQNRSKVIFGVVSLILIFIGIVLVASYSNTSNTTGQQVGGIFLFTGLVLAVWYCCYYLYCRGEYPDYYDGSTCDNCFGQPDYVEV